MTNQIIRAIQRANAHKLQAKPVKAVKPYINNNNSQHECDRRKRQVAKGQLKIENGLVNASI
jgi:hypothetical protein